MSLRRRFVASLTYAGLIAVACARSTADRGGLMLMISEAPPLSIDRLDIFVSTTSGTQLFGRSYHVPEEAALPTTLAVVSNGKADASVAVNVSGWVKGVPVDVRDAVIRSIPSDRVAAFGIVLSGNCTAQAGLVDDKAQTLCDAGAGDQTCDPTTGLCVPNAVDGRNLATYQHGQETKLGSGASGGSSGAGGSSNAGGAGGAHDRGCDDSCTSTQTCVGDTCVEQECTPSQRFCAGSSLKQCSNDGLSSVVIQDCDTGTYCDGDALSCTPGTCKPLEAACDGQRATTCNANGSGYAKGGAECDAGSSCRSGTCVPLVCSPGGPFCQGQMLKLCDDDGLGSSVTTTCADDEFCDGGSATPACRPWVCVPQAVSCSSNVVRKCNGEGSGWVELATCGRDQHCDATSGACASGACPEGYGDCTADAGCETPLGTQQNCLGCGDTCLAVNGKNDCTLAGCLPKCDAGYDDCNADVNDGCETDLTSDPNNCGGCMAVCSAPNAVASCTDSECSFTGCVAPYADCTSAPGCETDTTSNVQHCGSCDTACSKAGATLVSCTRGKCDPPACDATHADCDGNHENGCETVLGTLSHCTACDDACSARNGTIACGGPTKGCMPVCNAGFGDCDGNPGNGCESDFTTPAACGRCDNVCDAASETCVGVGSSYACQERVEYVNDTEGSTAAGTTLNVAHTLITGPNRLLLATVVTESTATAGVDGARPTAVTYAGIPMTAGAWQTSDASSAAFANPYLYYYFLTDTGGQHLPTAGTQTLQITATAGRVSMIAANVVEFTGVDQTNPLVAGSGKIVANPGATCVDTSDLTTTVPGTALFVASVAQVSGSATVSGSQLTQVPIWNSGQIGNQDRVYAAYGGTDTNVLDAGTYTIGFSWQWCNPAAELPLGIVPYRRP